MIKKENEKKIAAIILAAGQSRRMGRTKQLLPYNGLPLIHDICRKISQLNLEQTFCILGHDFPLIKKSISSFNIQVVHNKAYANGMSTSLKLGIEQVSQFPEIDGVLVVLADQPKIPLKHYRKLLSSFNQCKKNIVATSFSHTYGVPAIFDRSLFKEFMDLENDTGAKKIISTFAAQTDLILCPEAAFDIDTNQDYQNLID